MKSVGVIILVTLSLLTIFVLSNWSILTTSTPLTFITFQFEGQLGIILFGITLALVLLAFLYALSLRTTMLLESRRYVQELEAQRRLAENAEASRINELSSQIREEFVQLHNGIKEVETRMSLQEESLKKSLGETENSLSAFIGEMDDKIDRALKALQ